MPSSDQPRFRPGKKGGDGQSFIFDVDTIAIWLAFLLQNMFLTFGGQLKRQRQGTPMSTNCASHLANFFLAVYELRFLRDFQRHHSESSNGCRPQGKLRHCIQGIHAPRLINAHDALRPELKTYSPMLKTRWFITVPGMLPISPVKRS